MTPSSLDSAEIVHGQSLPDQSSERGGEIYFWSGIQGKGEGGRGVTGRDDQRSTLSRQQNRTFWWWVVNEQIKGDGEEEEDLISILDDCPITPKPKSDCQKSLFGFVHSREQLVTFP